MRGNVLILSYMYVCTLLRSHAHACAMKDILRGDF